MSVPDGDHVRLIAPSLSTPASVTAAPGVTCTCRIRDGGGAQAQRIISVIALARARGLQYCHTPMTRAAHAFDNVRKGEGGPAGEPWGPEARAQAARYFALHCRMPPNSVMRAIEEERELTEADVAALPKEAKVVHIKRLSQSNAVGKSH